MKRSHPFLRKCLMTALAAAVVLGVGALPAVSRELGTNVTVSALAASPVITYNNFQYILYSDKTAAVVGYTGPKDYADASFGMPSVLYAKYLDTSWSYNDYIDQYTITRMNGSIFNGCQFRILGLPSGLQSISGGFTGAQIGCFTISTANAGFYAAANGALYNKDKTELVAYPSKPTLYSTGASDITLLSTAKTIGSFAFTNLQLSQVTIPVTAVTIGDRAFSGSNVTKVTFKGSPYFSKLPPSAGDQGTFEGASKLQMITIEGTGGVFSTENGVLYNSDKTRLILCPQGRTVTGYFIMASSTTAIGDYAFYGCSKLPAIYIPETVTSIGSSSFTGTTGSFAIYGLQDTVAEDYAQNKNIPFHRLFSYSINDDDTVTITGYDGILSSVSIPKTIKGHTVSSIGEKAFYGKKTIKYVTIPAGIKSVGNYAFRMCTSLQSLTFPGTLETIGNYAFANTALTNVTIPSSVKALETAAFYSCTSLNTLKLNPNLEKIGAYAFENTALTAVTIPASVTSVGSNAFGYSYADSTHSRKASFASISGSPGTAAHEYAKKNNITFKTFLEYEKVTDENAIRITKYVGTDQAVTIPNYIDGYPVRYIAGKAFAYTPVVRVTLSAYVNQIDDYAFYSAQNLKYINIPSNIKRIGEYAFEFCASLTNVALPQSLISVGRGAFYGCTSLSSVALGGTQLVDRNAFVNTAMKKVTISKSVLTIDTHAFGYTYDNDGYHPVSGFEMTGYAYTAADTYAQQNTHIHFNVLYDKIVNTSAITSADPGNETITVHVSATGGKLPYQYAVDYRLKSESTWTAVQPCSDNSSVQITFPQSGDYFVNARIKDDRGETCPLVLDVTVELPLRNTSTFSAKTIVLGDSVTAKCTSTGGTGSVTYAVWYKNSNGKWFKVQDYAANDNVTVTPKNVETYTVRVKAKDTTGKVVNKEQKITVVAALKNTSTVSAGKIYLKDSVTAQGASTGGIGTKKYEAWFKSPSDGAWYKLQSYSTKTSVSFTPKYVGTYTVRMKVKDTTGKVVRKDNTVRV